MYMSMSDIHDFFPKNTAASVQPDALRDPALLPQVPSAEASAMDDDPQDKIWRALGGLEGVMGGKQEAPQPIPAVIETIGDIEERVANNIVPTLGSLKKKKAALSDAEVPGELQKPVTSIEATLPRAHEAVAVVEGYLDAATEDKTVPEEVTDQTYALFDLSTAYTDGHRELTGQYDDHGHTVGVFGRDMELVQQDAEEGASKIATVPAGFGKSPTSPEGVMAHDHADVLRVAGGAASAGVKAARTLSRSLTEAHALEGAPDPGYAVEVFQGLLTDLRKIGDGSGNGIIFAQQKLHLAKQVIADIAALTQELPGKHAHIAEDMMAVGAVADDLLAVPLFAEAS